MAIMSKLNSHKYVLGSSSLIFLTALLLRWCISLHSYSGEKTPPMYGDYEAQRHWMEITYNIPVEDWYKNTNDNNLTYWGLDYPPLTAYHSYLCGLFASVIVPDSIELHQSKGHEAYVHKLFMRSSVFVVDVLIYIPAVYLYFRIHVKSRDFLPINYSILLTLLYPGLMLIDYGHFQYNCVSLGLFIASVASMSSKCFAIASLFFCLAVNYKQMELYHSLPIFFYFLGEFFRLLKERRLMSSLKFIIPIATVVLSSFFILWLPFLSQSKALHVVHRIFPIARGVYEDKVATFWCMINIIFKLHRVLDNEVMFRICLFVTILCILPSIYDLTLHPNVEKFKLSLIICSLCFFLFSYHVHEKSILLVAIPISLQFPRHPILASWFLLISTFSMLPLLIKDNLFLPYLAVSVLYYVCCVLCISGYNINSLSLKTLSRPWKSVIINVSLFGCLILSLISRFCQPPESYPFLWPLLVSGYSFIHYVGFLLYFYHEQCLQRSIKKKIN